MRAVFSPNYSIDLGGHHPFPMAKYRRVCETLLDEGTLTAKDVLSPQPAFLSELTLVHTDEYASRFLEGRLTPGEQRRLGFPWSPSLCRRARFATGGTLLAAKCALSDGIAANLAGGSHHAFPDHGEGYCAFHDMAVAIRVLREAGPALRVAIVDCDVHQGNGSAAIFRSDPLVFTFSVHCQSNYPVEKVPGSRDAGLADGAGDEVYLRLLDEELDLLWRQFRPQLVFYQSGVDPLAGDRFGRLALSRDGLRRRDAAVLLRCLTTDTPAVVVLGGGYAARLEETVDAHADVVRASVALLRGEAWPPEPPTGSENGFQDRHGRGRESP